MALKKLEREWVTESEMVPHFLDLLSFRQVSAYVETVTGVQHESPQAIVLFQKRVIYHDSHQFIDLSDV
jgi:bacillithiol system protein YtxJ